VGRRRRFGIAALGAALAAAILSALACSDGRRVDPTRLRVFFSADVVGNIEPCG
jgi:hypothetical protein